MCDLRWVVPGRYLTPPCEKSAQVWNIPACKAETVHVGATAQGETAAAPAAGQASSPAAIPTTHAASISSASAGARRVPPSARAPEQGIHASQRAQPLEGADGCKRTRRE